MKKIFISALAIGFTLGLSAQSYKPAVKLEAGKKYEVISTVVGNTTMEAMGQSMDMPLETANKSTLTIKEVNNKGGNCSYVTDRMQFSLNMMGQEMIYDSDKKEDRDGKLGATMNKLVGAETTFIVDANGNVKQESVVKPNKEESNENGDMISGMIGNMGGANSDAVCPIFDLFKQGKEIKIGEVITDSVVNTDNDGTVKNVSSYTLKEITEGKAIFSTTGVITINKKVEAQGNEVLTNTTTKSKGEMTVDVSTGILLKKSAIMETTGSVDLQGMSIPMNSKMTTNTVVIAK
jgi:hypothetical protein